MKKSVLILIMFLIILCGCSSDKYVEDETFITYQDAQKMVNEGALLIDVRTEAEYNEKHIDGAVLMTIELINEKVASNVIPSKDTTVIVYCRSGARSSGALKMLKNLGYTNVYDLGSIDNWKE